MCGPEDPLFTPLLPLTRVPFQAKESVHKTPFWENLEILASTALIFTQILTHKPPNFEIFSSQAPKFGTFSAHTPPNLEIFRSQAPLFRGKCQFASPTLPNLGRTPLPEKKLSAPPPPPPPPPPRMTGLPNKLINIHRVFEKVCMVIWPQGLAWFRSSQTYHWIKLKFIMVGV